MRQHEVKESRRSRHVASGVVAAMETMECRRLLATLNGRELFIDGTAGSDRVRVEVVGTKMIVTTNGARQGFNRKDVKTLVANLRKGDDRIDIDWTVNVPTTLSGEAGNDTVVGGIRDDAIFTGSGDDVVYSGPGNDNIQTSVGSDFVEPGVGNDTIDTGDGTDEVSYADRATPVTAQIEASRVRLPPQGVDFDDRFTGSAQIGTESDVFEGTETITGGQGNDSLSLLTGRQGDTDPTSEAIIRANGNGGDDTFFVTDAFPSLNYVNFFGHVADGGDGDDSFETHTTSRSTVIGGDGNDTVRSTDDDASPPVITAGDGIDAFIWGGVFNMNYTMPPGLENLTVDGGADSIRIVGNEQDNVISASVSAFGATSSVDGLGGNDRITVFGNAGILNGGAGNDTLIGSDRADSINGGDGDDSIDGGGGADSIFGGNGSDRAKRDPADGIVDSIEQLV